MRLGSRVSIVAALAAAGCVSSSTWSSIHEVERRLSAIERAEGAARAEPPEGALGCERIVALALARSPGLRAPRSRARAALAEARAAGAMPAPMLELEVWDFPIGDPQLADREGMYMAGLAQEIPPAAALDGEARAAAEEAEDALSELSERTREVRARASHACAEWAAAGAESASLASSEALIERMRELVAAQVSTGAPVVELARLDGEAARLARMRAQAEARGDRARATIEALLDLEIDARAPALAEPAPIAVLEPLIARAIEARGAIAAARARSRAAAARADAADARASVPTFRIAATYMQMPAARAGLGVQLGMTLPWLSGGEGAARDAARLEADAGLDDAAFLERTLRVEVIEAARGLEVAARALAVLRARERPAAARALEAIEATYASGQGELGAWLDAARMLRELDVEEARLLGESAHARAELEGALGIALEAEGGER